MKRLNILIMAIVTSILLVSCEIDNVKQPNCSFKGTIIDAGTGKPFEAQIGSKVAMLRLREDNPKFLNPIYEYGYIMENGSFEMRGMPETSYVIDTYNCPLVLSQSEKVILNPNKTQEVTLYCLPYLRIELWQDNDRLCYVITMPEELQGKDGYTGQIININLCYGTNNKLSDASCSTILNTLVAGEVGSGYQSAILGTEYSIPMSKFTQLEAGRYYFRAIARLEGIGGTQRNYSNVIYADVKPEYLVQE